MPYFCFVLEFRELIEAELVRHRTLYRRKLKKKSNLTFSSLPIHVSVRVNNNQRRKEIIEDVLSAPRYLQGHLNRFLMVFKRRLALPQKY